MTSFENMAGSASLGSLVVGGTTTFVGGVPTPERLTLQREANDLHAAIMRAGAVLSRLTESPTPETNQSQNAPLMPLGAALSACRNEMNRLVERLDAVSAAVGQL